VKLENEVIKYHSVNVYLRNVVEFSQKPR